MRYEHGAPEWHAQLLYLENELRKVQGMRADLLRAARETPRPDMCQFWLAEEAALAETEAEYHTDIAALRQEMALRGF